LTSVDARFAELTMRELDVALLVSRGLSNKEIAVSLGIALPTVKTYVRTIMLKLNARNRTEVAVLTSRRTVSADA
jgi:DNA-binding NarL/FixJ family response regulator